MLDRLMRRPPDFIIGEPDRAYLRRWWIIPRNRFFNIYLHEFLRSDDDRALHDHPWINLSIVLRGSYREWRHYALDSNRPGVKSVVRVPGDIVMRLPSTAHRIELVPQIGTTVTLFITGPRVREWGFHCPNGWVHWRVFTSGPRGETIGKGCGDD